MVNVLIRPLVRFSVLVLMLGSGRALAQEPLRPAPQPVQGPALPEIARISPDAALRAYSALEGWVRAASMPDDAQAPAGLERLGACSVALRLDHHVIGRAFDLAGGPDSFLRVSRAALAQATPHLPVGHDATAEQQLRDAAARITISLELAGTLIPTKFGTFADADAELEPGLDGIAARFGEKIAGTFPADMLITNRTPGSCLATAISDATGDSTLPIPGAPKNEAGVIATDHHGTYYRFRAVHIAQTMEGRAPEFLFRSGRVASPEQISTKGMVFFADTLAQNLEARIRKDGTMAGTLMPALGRYAPETAEPLDQAMAAAALAMYAELDPHKLEIIKNPPAWAALDGAATLMKASSIEATQNPMTAAAWTMAAAAARRMNNERLQVDATLTARVGACVSSAYDAEAGWSKEVKPSERSLIALGLALRAAEPGAPAELRAKAESAVGSILLETPPKILVSQMPWLGEAALVLAGAQGPLGPAPALREMRDLIWKYQLTADDAGPDGEDLVGGIVFTTSRNPLPTWLTVRPVIFLAEAARDQRLTDQNNPNEKLREVSRLLSSMRFLRQLMLDDASGYSAEDLIAAYGGVRSSLWDQRQPPEATALTLMAVCETLRTLK